MFWNGCRSIVESFVPCGSVGYIYGDNDGGRAVKRGRVRGMLSSAVVRQGGGRPSVVKMPLIGNHIVRGEQGVGSAELL